GVMITSDFSVSSLVIAVLVEIFDLSDPSIADLIRKVESYAELEQVLDPAGVRLRFDKKMWKTVVHLDAAKVKQILRNLVTNAFKHRACLVEIFGGIEEKQMLLKVRDDGRGIPTANHQRIFETYFTTGGPIETAIESHGLGLAGVMVLLKDMGGGLILESDDGKGAEFIVNIPL
ncbi:MAG: ATP-binding protein, partial [Desulfobacteraceae bacterium]|nr:ATP-binding protein [Desulfobacteraceae bacterium]